MAKVVGTLSSSGIEDGHKFLVKKGPNDYTDISYINLKAALGLDVSVSQGNTTPIQPTDVIIVVKPNSSRLQYTWEEFRKQMLDINIDANGTMDISTMPDNAIISLTGTTTAATFKINSVTTPAIDRYFTIVNGTPNISHTLNLADIGLAGTIIIPPQSQMIFEKRGSITRMVDKSRANTLASDIIADTASARVDGTVQAALIDLGKLESAFGNALNAAVPNNMVLMTANAELISWGDIDLINWA